MYLDDGTTPAPPEVADAVRAAASVCERAGMITEEARPPGVERAYDLFFSVYGADGGAMIRDYAHGLGTTQLHPLTEGFLGLAEPYATSTSGLLARLFELDAFRATMLDFMTGYDALLCPGAALPAPRHGQTLEPDVIRGLAYATAFNLTGWPVATIPAGHDLHGLPIGVQVAAAPWREEIVLAIARCIEDVSGGWRAPLLAEIT